MKKLILGVDAGNYEGKVAGPFGSYSFKTNISYLTELKVVEVHGDDDMVFEIDGRKGLAGTIALYENPYGSSGMYGTSKAHDDTKVRVLLAIYRYMKKYDIKADSVSIVTGQPIAGHDDVEKRRIIDMLEGEHPIKVNGENVTIKIGEVGVAPEGTGAFWSSNQEHATCKVLDIGSGTVNAVSFKDFRHINFNSNTFNYGTETRKQDVVIRGAIMDTTALGWGKEDVVLVCGGSAGLVTEEIKKHYQNAEVLTPTLVLDKGSSQVLEPKFANAVGFYTLAQNEFR